MCSENKGADQLRGYREAGLCLCFCLCRLLVFSCGGSFLMFRYIQGDVSVIVHDLQIRLLFYLLSLCAYTRVNM